MVPGPEWSVVRLSDARKNSKLLASDSVSGIAWGTGVFKGLKPEYIEFQSFVQKAVDR